MNLQANYDLKTAAAESGKDIGRQIRPRGTIMTRIWEKLSGAEKRAPRIVVQ